eukprot:45347_1
MPRRSFTTRRGKPRLESQQENAILSTRFNRNLPKHRRSKLAQLDGTLSTNNSNQKYKHDDNNTQEDMSSEQLQKRMWKHMDVTSDNPLSAPLMSSSFATRYPEHRESYIRMSSGKMKEFLKKYGVSIQVLYDQCTLIVSSTARTWDPYSIIKARDMIRLIARYVPFEHASKVMTDNVFSDIIEIGKTNVARNQVRFIKRRARLIGPNGVTLRAIELLTKCYVLVYGRTVCVIGASKGIAVVRKIVMDCMNNIHPIYQLKRLMVEQELSSNPELANVSWDRFLPSFKKLKRNNNTAFGARKMGVRNGLTVNQIKKMANKKKRTNSNKYTPWPPAPTMSKIDIAMESGAYWNKEWRKDNLKRMTAEQKFMKNKTLHQKQQLNQKQTFKKKQKTLKRIRKEMRFVQPQEIDSNKIRMRLRTANSRDKGNYITGTTFRENIDKFHKQNKTQNSKNVNKFLL